jgi:hypothetical protein
MKSVLTIIAVAAVAFAISGCAKQAPAGKAAVKFMNAKELGKEFAKGSKVCSWKAGKKGRDKGTDYYYKDISAMSGNADRILGKTMLQGKWGISGDTLSLNFGIGKPQLYKLVKVKKKTYTAYLNGKKKKMTFKCK